MRRRRGTCIPKCRTIRWGSPFSDLMQLGMEARSHARIAIELQQVPRNMPSISAKSPSVS